MLTDDEKRRLAAIVRGLSSAAEREQYALDLLGQYYDTVARYGRQDVQAAEAQERYEFVRNLTQENSNGKRRD